MASSITSLCSVKVPRSCCCVSLRCLSLWPPSLVSAAPRFSGHPAAHTCRTRFSVNLSRAFSRSHLSPCSKTPDIPTLHQFIAQSAAALAKPETQTGFALILWLAISTVSELVSICSIMFHNIVLIRLITHFHSMLKKLRWVSWFPQYLTYRQFCKVQVSFVFHSLCRDWWI